MLKLFPVGYFRDELKYSLFYLSIQDNSYPLCSACREVLLLVFLIHKIRSAGDSFPSRLSSVLEKLLEFVL